MKREHPLTLAVAAFALALLAAVSGCISARRDADVSTSPPPLKISISQVDVVTERGKPQPVEVVVENTSQRPLAGEVTIGLVADWRTCGPASSPFELAAGQKASLGFNIAAGEMVYPALYPVHATAKYRFGGRNLVSHDVCVFESKIPLPAKAAPEWQPVEVPDEGGLSLIGASAFRVAWKYFDKPLERMPVGWQGSVDGCRASVHMAGDVVRGGVKRRSINMHPPWTGGVGTVFAEFPLMLPDAECIRLRFATAIRDHSEREPPSDGVLFRVWVDDEAVFERFSASKEWESAECDLTAWAGKTILLRLESHPGPKKDTTCDSCYWAEPVVIAGSPPPEPTEEEKKAVLESMVSLGRRLLGQGDQLPQAVTHKGCFAWAIGQGDERFAAVVAPGRQGIIDAQVALVYPDAEIAWGGFQTEIEGQIAGVFGSPLRCLSVDARRTEHGMAVSHAMACRGEEFPLTVSIWPEGGALRMKWNCTKHITDVHPRPFSHEMGRVILGNGTVIGEPEDFRLSAGGHTLAASFVGCEFSNGISLLQAVDLPPKHFECLAEARKYALHGQLDCTFTLLPSRKGAFDAALRYRPLCKKRAAPTVPKLAGRFVFDVWGGKYADIADNMRTAARYGMTDSMLMVHVWQRWGYDFRLPDIFPPNSEYGTLEDMQQIGKACREHDILWGPHDNYIDFYPDATGYSYKHICFTQNGYPIKAWLNTGRDAQSYRWRPDHIMPFVKRNIALIKKNLRPTAYFIDVFTSIPCIPFYDYDGHYHPATQTQYLWGSVFAYIRDELGQAPQISEAGHDQLIGWLDGAQCQHLGISRAPQRHRWRILCKDWERVPWFDIVHHDTFILHGVGYSCRYQGGLSYANHGIYSDDYISCEVLNGHPGMVERRFDRNWVAKYWLTQPISRALAMKRIKSVALDGDDIHRVSVEWDNGTVHVNRGESLWCVDGRRLPQYGYLARVGDVESAIEELDGEVVAHTSMPGYLFCDARTVNPAQCTLVRVKLAEVEYVGDRQYKFALQWDTDEPPDGDHRIFVHFCYEWERRGEIAFQADHNPPVPTSQWSGKTITNKGALVELPEDVKPGRYKIRVGLYHPETHDRLVLMGPPDGERRVRLGTLILEGSGDQVTGMRVEPEEDVTVEPPPRYNRTGKAIDFGPVTTNGAFRIRKIDGGLELTPLPGQPAAAVAIRLDRLFGGVADKVVCVRGVSVNGAERDIAFQHQDRILRFELEPPVWKYDIYMMGAE